MPSKPQIADARRKVAEYTLAIDELRSRMDAGALDTRQGLRDIAALQRSLDYNQSILDEAKRIKEMSHAD